MLKESGVNDGEPTKTFPTVKISDGQQKVAHEMLPDQSTYISTPALGLAAPASLFAFNIGKGIEESSIFISRNLLNGPPNRPI